MTTEALPFRVGGLAFKNKTEAKRLIQSLVRTCPEGGVTPEAKEVLNWLFLDSEDYKLTRGGRYRFSVKHKQHVDVEGVDRRGRIFTIRWGWNGTIDAKSHALRVTQAAREAIKHQRPQRNHNVHTHCTICQHPLAVTDDTHWHHAGTPFVTIWQSFLKREGTCEDHIGLTKTTKDFVDPSFKQRWVNYHGAHVQFQIAHAGCNLREKP